MPEHFFAYSIAFQNIPKKNFSSKKKHFIFGLGSLNRTIYGMWRFFPKNETATFLSCNVKKSLESMNISENKNICQILVDS